MHAKCAAADLKPPAERIIVIEKHREQTAQRPKEKPTGVRHHTEKDGKPSTEATELEKVGMLFPVPQIFDNSSTSMRLHSG